MTMMKYFFAAILVISRFLFFCIMIIRLPFDFPVLQTMPEVRHWLINFLTIVSLNWVFYTTFPLLHYRHKIGQFIFKALKNYRFVVLLVYASYEVLFFVLFIDRGRGVSFPNNNNNDNKKDDQWSYINECSGVMAMSTSFIAILSVVKLVATPADASTVARFFMAHFLVNTLLLFRDGASKVALAAAFFPLLLAIIADMWTPADTPILPCKDMQIKQVSDSEKVKIKQVSNCEEVQISISENEEMNQLTHFFSFP